MIVTVPGGNHVRAAGSPDSGRTDQRSLLDPGWTKSGPEDTIWLVGLIRKEVTAGRRRSAKAFMRRFDPDPRLQFLSGSV